MVAAAVYVYTQAGPTGVGVLAVARYLSIAFASPFAATLADRHPRVRVMVVSDLVRLVTVGAAAVVIWARFFSIVFPSLAPAPRLVGRAKRRDFNILPFRNNHLATMGAVADPSRAGAQGRI